MIFIVFHFFLPATRVSIQIWVIQETWYQIAMSLCHQWLLQTFGKLATNLPNFFHTLLQLLHTMLTVYHVIISIALIQESLVTKLLSLQFTCCRCVGNIKTVGSPKVGLVKKMEPVVYFINHLFVTLFASWTTNAENSVSQSHSFQITFLLKAKLWGGCGFAGKLDNETEDELPVVMRTLCN